MSAERESEECKERQRREQKEEGEGERGGWRGGEKVRGVEKRSEGGRHKCVEERGERRR